MSSKSRIFDEMRYLAPIFHRTRIYIIASQLDFWRDASSECRFSHDFCEVYGYNEVSPLISSSCNYSGKIS